VLTSAMFACGGRCQEFVGAFAVAFATPLSTSAAGSGCLPRRALPSHFVQVRRVSIAAEIAGRARVVARGGRSGRRVAAPSRQFGEPQKDGLAVGPQAPDYAERGWFSRKTNQCIHLRRMCGRLGWRAILTCGAAIRFHRAPPSSDWTLISLDRSHGSNASGYFAPRGPRVCFARSVSKPIGGER